MSGVLTVEKGGDGKITAGVVDVPGASDQADALVAKTRSALDRIAGAAAGRGTPAAELGQALMPGALAVGAFVPAGRAQMVETGMQNLGAHVLSPADLKRIGAGMAAVQGNGTLDSDGTAASPPVTPPAAAVFDWHAEYTYSHGVQAFIYGFPYMYLAQVPLQVDPQRQRPGAPALLALSGSSGMPRTSWMPPSRTAAVRTTTRCTRSRGSTSQKSR